MGATNEIKETNIGQALIGKTCERCDKNFTRKDICEDNNWAVDFDTSNDVELVDNEIKGYGYNLTIWIRNAYHEDCDDAKFAGVEDKEKTEWQKLGDKIKNAPNEIMEELANSQKRAVEFMKNQKKHGKR
jgi:hypothetical protein